MASSLLALLDDIATILDDVAVLTKVAAKKTSRRAGRRPGAERAAGHRRGGGPGAAGGLGGGQGVLRQQGHPGAGRAGHQRGRALGGDAAADGRRRLSLLRGLREARARVCPPKADDAAHEDELARALADPAVDLVALERDKIKGAIRTDFILSAEIIVISLGTVAGAAFPQRVAVLVGIAVLMTVGVYGLVAGIVKLDDGGLHLVRRTGAGLFARTQRALGAAILRVAPWLMKGLSVAGTAAMFLVGGGIIRHGIPPLHHFAESLPGGLLVSLPFDALTGIAAGALVVGIVLAVQRLRRVVT